MRSVARDIRPATEDIEKETAADYHELVAAAGLPTKDIGKDLEELSKKMDANSFGRLIGVLRKCQTQVERMHGRIDELERTFVADADFKTFENHVTDAFGKNTGMLNYCYMVCKKKPVMDLAGIEERNPLLARRPAPTS